MKRIPTLIVKWLANKLGYKTAMIKIGGEIPQITIEGDKELLKYVDITGYKFNKEPLSRIHKPPTSAKEMFLAEPKPDVSNKPHITKLTPEQLEDLGIKH
jgi:hypothetical protein